MFTFTLLNKFHIIQFCLTFCVIISMFLMLYNYRKSLETQYKVTEKNDEILFYTLFKNNLLKNRMSKETLTKAKEILEIETREEKNHLTLYFIGYSSLILLPTMFITFEEYIRTYIIIPSLVIIMAFLLPVTFFLINVFFNRKQITKMAILKKIERIIIELS